jgi:hypothetical protein
MNDRSRPAGAAPEVTTTAAISTQTADIVRLRHGLHAVYVRDSDQQRIALRRLKRCRSLTPEQRVYEAWIAEQRQDVAS